MDSTATTSEATEKTPQAELAKTGTQTTKTEATASQSEAGFTQADIDRIVTQRLKEDREKREAKAREDKAKQDGDYQTLLDGKEKENAALAETNRKLVIRNAVLTQAGKLGIQKVDVALRLLNEDDIEYSETGEPKNLEKLLKAIIAEVPSIAGNATLSTGGATNTDRTQQQQPLDPKRPPTFADIQWKT